MLKIIKTVFNTFVDWSNILNKPSIFPPSAHTQDISTINGLQAELDSKVEASEYDSKINQDVRISSAPTFKDIIIRETTTSDASLNIIGSASPQSPLSRITFGDNNNWSKGHVRYNHPAECLEVAYGSDVKIRIASTINLISQTNIQNPNLYLNGLLLTCPDGKVLTVAGTITQQGNVIVRETPDLNMWFKVLTHQFNGVSWDCYNVLEFHGWGGQDNGVANNCYAKVIMQSGQWSSMSYNPVVEVRVLGNLKNFNKDDFMAVVTTNTTDLKVVELWMKNTKRWNNYNYTINASRTLYSGAVITYHTSSDNGGAQSVLPTGTQIPAVYMDAQTNSLNINGTQIIDSNGNVQASSYKSSDGSLGVTGSFTSADGKTVIVKNGIVTSIA
ncbi:MAG: hypothetical protein A2104_03385 [Candidatus Melainabacteria bacterium GWF2_32_7]|nr:MAG: hypothetical protein A2104_03385 [Candidatus Melainabacteria bacterium GWF2_32_7]